jgi:hypothetical protein
MNIRNNTNNRENNEEWKLITNIKDKITENSLSHKSRQRKNFGNTHTRLIQTKN